MTLILFLIVLSVLVLVHEFGHFIVARFFKITVEEFAFGFPPRLLSTVKNGTRYSLNLFPIGGYVKLLGEDGGSQAAGSFMSKSVISRLLVIVAGVIMNLILAVIILAIGFSIGMTPLFSSPESLGGSQQNQVIVVGISVDSPAMQAGIQSGDKIKSIEAAGQTQLVETIANLQSLTKTHKGESVSVAIERSGQLQTFQVNLANNDTPLGVGLQETSLVKLPLLAAIKAGFSETGRGIWAVISFVGISLKQLFTVGHITADVAGPVGIYSITGQAAKLGFTFLLQLIALLSINLAVLNILPFPALDGGRALFILLEGIFKRKVVREQIEGTIHTIGFIILLILIGLITIKDILRIL